MVKKQNKNPIVRDIEKLLDQQTAIILTAVDAKLEKFEGRIRADVKSEIEKLAKTLDKFLVRLTKFDDEFKIVKAKVDRIEKILQDKLGVTID
jgi:hypothetical protein